MMFSPRKQAGNTILAILITFVCVTAAVGATLGWVFNLIALIHLAQIGDITALLLVRVLGIFVFPLGVVLGWCF